MSDRSGDLGMLGIAAGMHAGLLMFCAGLGVVPGKAAAPTRTLLMQASLRLVQHPPGGNFDATWHTVERVAALALAEAIDVITED